MLVDKSAYGLRIPFTELEFTPGAAVQRGEVIIFDSPRNGDRLIKRVVGIGGDTVTIHDGSVFVNGLALAERDRSVEFFADRKAILNLDDGGGPDLNRLRIPSGMLLTVGDHRGNSLDGRFFGLIEESEAYGKALGVYRRRGEGFVWLPL